MLAASHVNAASLPALTDDYDGNYNAESVNTGSNLHTFWLPGLFSGVDAYWQFDADGGTFNYDGTTAVLSGRIEANNQSAGQDLALDVNAKFSFVSKGTIPAGSSAPKCEFGGGCTSEPFLTNKQHFEYFDYVPGEVTLTGAGDLLGLELALLMFPTDGKYPPQLGYGANNKDVNEFGFSSWFRWAIESQATNTNFVALAHTGDKKHGDINLHLTPVPLPAGFALLLTGLFGLGLAARRRRIAA